MTEKWTLDELLDQFKAMTLVKLQAFVTRFEETFGVSAAFVVPSDAMRGRVEVEQEQEEEPTAFDVVLLAVESTARIRVIKELRAIVGGLGLAEAKQRVDSVPVVVAQGLDFDAAQRMAFQLEAAGATVEVRPADGEGAGVPA